MSCRVHNVMHVASPLKLVARSLVVTQCSRGISTTSTLCKTVNVQRPRLRASERRILDAITRPVMPKDHRQLPEICYVKQREAEDAEKSELMDAYFAFKLKEAKEMFNSNQMIAVCHRLPTLERNFVKLKVKVAQAGFKLRPINNYRARQALGDTKMANLIPYFRSDTCLVLREQPDLPGLLKLLRKTPEILLLGAFVESHILSRDQITEAARLPSLDQLRGELVTVLSASASKTSRMLLRHQQELSANLTQYVTQSSQEAEQATSSTEKTDTS